MPVGRTALLAGVTGAAGLAARYAAGRARVDRAWRQQTASRLADVGEVAWVSILPLVERLSPGHGLRGEPGVAYLVCTPHVTLLFDCGLGTGRSISALAGNAAVLGVGLAQLDGVVISHLHRDHVGGTRALSQRTFAFAPEPLEPPGLPAYVPVPMRHARAQIVVVDRPRVLAPGVAVLPPLPQMLFWAGPVSEQALVVNVAGVGLVVISGCGHPAIERMIATTEEILDLPIGAVVGGLHLPVHPVGTPLLRQALVANPHWPWQPIGEDDARMVIRAIRERGPRLVALSGHDSTEWTLAAFAAAFGDRYTTLQVGAEIRIDATTSRPPSARGSTPPPTPSYGRRSHHPGSADSLTDVRTGGWPGPPRWFGQSWLACR
jgi:7,8-dihydropterin-6-yl-methyl-4-(beta-D-ribofuranosyl)aminobenzene 5'-phosphate synthase